MRLNQLKAAIFILLVVLVNIAYSQVDNRAIQVQNEKQPIADQGNGYYKNPIISGNYGDPSLVRVDEDYYMAFSRGNGFIIWHSSDLVNWEPIYRQTLPEGFNIVWAVDLQYFDGKFYLYMPIRQYPGKKASGFGNFVSIAEKPEGPWNDPINIEIPTPDYEGWGSIDPGFVQTPGGEKYLYTSAGNVVRLNDNGTKALGLPQKVYDGWKYPEEWNVECLCLESPKLFKRDGFYYLISAEGGTSGPSTAHMTVVARSEFPTGPWENSPYNPLVHTYSQNEKFWHQGHGTIFEAADESWWTVYHARLNNYTEVGRCVLLLPVEWTEDDWPVIKNGYNPADLIPVPKGENVGHGLVLSDDFLSEKVGRQWNLTSENATRIKVGNGKLTIQAEGKSAKEGVNISVGAVNTSFEVTVEIEVQNENTFAGISLGNNGIQVNEIYSTFSDAPEWRMRGAQIPLKNKGKVYMKIKNYRKDLSFFVSDDGTNWQSFGKGLRKHDSYNIQLFAFGEGEAVFRNFTYLGLEK